MPDHEERLEDRPVGEPLLAEFVEVVLTDLGGRGGRLRGEVAQGPLPGSERRGAVVGLHRPDDLLACALGPEGVSVGARSVATAVRPGDDDRDHLALGARELALREHDLAVQRRVATEDAWPQAECLDHVGHLPAEPAHVVVELAEGTVGLVFLDHPDPAAPRHSSPPGLVTGPVNASRHGPARSSKSSHSSIRSVPRYVANARRCST